MNVILKFKFKVYFCKMAATYWAQTEVFGGSLLNLSYCPNEMYVSHEIFSLSTAIFFDYTSFTEASIIKIKCYKRFSCIIVRVLLLNMLHFKAGSRGIQLRLQ